MKKGKIVLCVSTLLLCTGVLAGCSDSTCGSSRGDDEEPANWNDVIDFLDGMFMHIEPIWGGFSNYKHSTYYVEGTKTYESEEQYFYTSGEDDALCGTGFSSSTDLIENSSSTTDYYFDGKTYSRTTETGNDTTYNVSRYSEIYSEYIEEGKDFIDKQIYMFTEIDSWYGYDYCDYVISATKSKHSVGWETYYDKRYYETYIYDIKVETDSNYLLNSFSLETTRYYYDDLREVSTQTITRDEKVSTSKPSWVNNTNFSD